MVKLWDLQIRAMFFEKYQFMVPIYIYAYIYIYTCASDATHIATHAEMTTSLPSRDERRNLRRAAAPWPKDYWAQFDALCADGAQFIVIYPTSLYCALARQPQKSGTTKKGRWWRRKVSDLFLGALQRFCRIFTLQNGEDYLATANLFRMGCFATNCWWVLPSEIFGELIMVKVEIPNQKWPKVFTSWFAMDFFFNFFGVFFWPKILSKWARLVQRVAKDIKPQRHKIYLLNRFLF